MALILDNPEISLVILDLQMPGWDGETTLERLQERAPTVKVLISSGNLDSSKRDRLTKIGASGFIPKLRLTKIGASGFIPKPYDSTELLAAVAGVMAP